jgi:hypothetical protein
MTKPTPLIVAIVLLLLPALYVGSYLALVTPVPSEGKVIQLGNHSLQKYRFGRHYAERFYWPLEQVDRRLRLNAWRIRFAGDPEQRRAK